MESKGSKPRGVLYKSAEWALDNVPNWVWLLALVVVFLCLREIPVVNRIVATIVVAGLGFVALFLISHAVHVYGKAADERKRL